MSITITCSDNTQVTRHRTKIKEELKSIQFLEDSIRNIKLAFSGANTNAQQDSPVECVLSLQIQSEQVKISQNANSEMRAFNLCLEELLYSLLTNAKFNINGEIIKNHFPYVSVEPGTT